MPDAVSKLTGGSTDDRAYVIGKTSLQTAQYACLAATPIYLVQALRKGTFSFRNLARYNWTVPLIGGGAGAGYGAFDATNKNSASLSAQATKLRYDSTRVRQEDYHLIGAAVGALILPALLLKRVGLINGALGGAGLGGAAGLGYHFYEQATGGVAKPAMQRDAESVAGKVQRESENLADKAKDLGREALAKGKEATGQ